MIPGIRLHFSSGVAVTFLLLKTMKMNGSNVQVSSYWKTDFGALKSDA